jgi:hypothetical protein
MSKADFRWARPAVYAALTITLVVTVLDAFAFTSIYRREDTRLEAERWIRNNVSPGATVGIHGISPFADPYLDPTVYQIHVLPVTRIYRESTSHPYDSGLLWRFIRPKLPETRERPSRLSDEEVAALVDMHLRSDYLVLSSRLTDQLGAAAKAIGQDSNPGFHRILRYYEALLGGQSPYAVAMSFESRPRLWGFTVDDAPAEYSFKIADHPTIVIYRRTISAPKRWL